MTSRCLAVSLVLAIYALSGLPMNAYAAEEASVQRMCKAVPLLQPDLAEMWDDEKLAEVLCSMTIIITTAGLKGKRNEECEIARQIIYEEAKRRGVSETAQLECAERIRPNKEVGGDLSAEDEASSTAQYLKLSEVADPIKEMAPRQRNMAMLAASTDHWLKQGNLKKAEKTMKATAALMHQYYNQYRALVAASQSGDVKRGLILLQSGAFIGVVRSPELVPLKDGRLGIKYVDDASGEVKGRMVMTPEEMTEFLFKGGMTFAAPAARPNWFRFAICPSKA